MKIKAAILEQYNTPFVIEEVELLDEPKDGEVLVRMVATGLCHTDIACAKGDLMVPTPIVLGHEGAGIVEKVGRCVTEVKPGDKVVIPVTPHCRKCPACVRGEPFNCERLPSIAVYGGTLADGTKRLKRQNGDELNHFFMQSSFAEYAVIGDDIAIKVRDDAPLDVVCCLGCGVTTGIGAVVNRAKVAAGSTVAVFGCGAVGLSVVMASRFVGAGRIFAIDILDSKLEVARELGATDLINASKEDPVSVISGALGWGANYCFECIGNTDVMTMAVNATDPAGMTLLLGMAPIGQSFSVEAWRMLREQVVTGAGVGHLRPSIDIPRFIDLYMEGKLPVEKIVQSARYPLEQINEAVNDMTGGKCIHPVITY
jgi:Zn-dependent alcohol dehydrogenase